MCTYIYINKIDVTLATERNASKSVRSVSLRMAVEVLRRARGCKLCPRIDAPLARGRKLCMILQRSSCVSIDRTRARGHSSCVRIDATLARERSGSKSVHTVSLRMAVEGLRRACVDASFV